MKIFSIINNDIELSKDNVEGDLDIDKEPKESFVKIDSSQILQHLPSKSIPLPDVTSSPDTQKSFDQPGTQQKLSKKRKSIEPRDAHYDFSLKRTGSQMHLIEELRKLNTQISEYAESHNLVDFFKKNKIDLEEILVSTKFFKNRDIEAKIIDDEKKVQNPTLV